MACPLLTTALLSVVNMGHWTRCHCRGNVKLSTQTVDTPRPGPVAAQIPGSLRGKVRDHHGPSSMDEAGPLGPCSCSPSPTCGQTHTGSLPPSPHPLPSSLLAHPSPLGLSFRTVGGCTCAQVLNLSFCRPQPDLPRPQRMSDAPLTSLSPLRFELDSAASSS